MLPSATPLPEPSTPDEARRAVLLAIADDELVAGHRASNWTGVAPSIEEDLAFSTIAQDEVNHADVWYRVLLTGDGEVDRAAVDQLALARDVHEYRHAVTVERDHAEDFGLALARHWCYDHFDALRLGSLADSTDPDVAAVAAKLLHEERYHLEHADLWFRRLADADDEAQARWRSSLATELTAALALFEPVPGEALAVEDGLLAEPTTAVFTRWVEFVTATLTSLGWQDLLPDEVASEDLSGCFDEPGGRHGIHTADFTDDVWPNMTMLARAHPEASW